VEGDLGVSAGYPFIVTDIISWDHRYHIEAGPPMCRLWKTGGATNLFL
jgi:hypothetical protein